MSEREPPTRPRVARAEFRGELLERARARGCATGASAKHAATSAVALLDVAARFRAQVAERLDRAGDKTLAAACSTGWRCAARPRNPARMPVVFKLADTARDAGARAEAGAAAGRRRRRQRGVRNRNRRDARARHARLLVGVDAGEDAYFLPPPGLSSLDPLEPLPERWRVKSFADAGADACAARSGAGPRARTCCSRWAAGNSAYSPWKATWSPSIRRWMRGGIAAGSIVTKVTRFDPFGTAVRNQQEHVVYLGDDDLFNLEAASVLQIRGTGQKLSNATWEYFGKSADRRYAHLARAAQG